MSAGTGCVVYDNLDVLEVEKGSEKCAPGEQKENFRINLVKLNILDAREKD